MECLRCCVLLLLLVVAAVRDAEARCDQQRQNVKVDKCTGKVCILRKGENTGITIKFRPDKQYPRLKAKVTGVLGKLRVPFGGVPSDACSGLVEGSCPVVPGQEYTYRAQIPVSRAYPSIGARVEYFLVDEATEEPVACSSIRVQIR